MKVNRVFTFVILSLLLISLSVVGVSATNVLVNNNGSGIPGSVNRPVELALNNPDLVGGLQFNLAFPSSTLTYNGFQTTSRTTGATVADNLISPGLVVVSVLKDISVGSGPILNLLFNVSASATPADYTLSFSDLVIGDDKGVALSSSFVNGVFTVIPPCIDVDGDGFGIAGANTGCTFVGVDCNDGDNTIHPGAADAVCNGIDNNCDGTIDNGFVSTPTSCGVGACAATGGLVCSAGSLSDTCTPGTPTAEVCDGIDNDCNSLVDDGIADITNGTDVGVCQVEVQSCIGGQFVVTQAAINPSLEICDGLDNNCNGLVDDKDSDIDGFNDCTTDFCSDTSVGSEVVQSGVFAGCTARQLKADAVTEYKDLASDLLQTGSELDSGNMLDVLFLLVNAREGIVENNFLYSTNPPETVVAEKKVSAEIDFGEGITKIKAESGGLSNETVIASTDINDITNAILAFGLPGLNDPLLVSELIEIREVRIVEGSEVFELQQTAFEKLDEFKGKKINGILISDILSINNDMEFIQSKLVEDSRHLATTLLENDISCLALDVAANSNALKECSFGESFLGQGNNPSLPGPERIDFYGKAWQQGVKVLKELGTLGDVARR